MEHDISKVKTALNNCDESFPLGIVECKIIFQDGDNSTICPLLSHKLPDGRLRYTFETYQRLIKTTIDIMEAVKHNHAKVVEVYNALLWTERYPIFKESINRLFKMRQTAKESGNKSLSQVAKLLMVSSYGKTGQRLHDNKIIISDDNSEIDKYYQKGSVKTDIKC